MLVQIHECAVRDIAEQVHSIMEDKALYSVNAVEKALRVYLIHHIEGALLQSLPEIISASGRVSERPALFNVELKEPAMK